MIISSEILCEALSKLIHNERPYVPQKESEEYSFIRKTIRNNRKIEGIHERSYYGLIFFMSNLWILLYELTLKPT